jgi:hypothetical protein
LPAHAHGAVKIQNLSRLILKVNRPRAIYPAHLQFQPIILNASIFYTAVVVHLGKGSLASFEMTALYFDVIPSPSVGLRINSARNLSAGYDAKHKFNHDPIPKGRLTGDRMLAIL